MNQVNRLRALLTPLPSATQGAALVCGGMLGEVEKQNVSTRDFSPEMNAGNEKRAVNTTEISTFIFLKVFYYLYIISKIHNMNRPDYAVGVERKFCQIRIPYPRQQR